MADTKQHEPDAFDTIADNKIVRNLVFFGSGIIALTTAGISIWDEFYAEIKKQAPFKDFRDAKHEAIDAVRNAGYRNELTPKQVIDGVHKANSAYTKLIDEALPKMGIPDGFLRGTWARARELGGYNIVSILFKTGASLAITIGGYYLINQNVRLKSSNEHQDERLRDLRDRIDAQESRRIEAFERT